MEKYSKSVIMFCLSITLAIFTTACGNNQKDKNANNKSKTPEELRIEQEEREQQRLAEHAERKQRRLAEEEQKNKNY